MVTVAIVTATVNYVSSQVFKRGYMSCKSCSHLLTQLLAVNRRPALRIVYLKVKKKEEKKHLA